MRYPKLYDEHNNAVGRTGSVELGLMVDVISATVTEEINGEYELVMRYPYSGAFGNVISQTTLIECLVSPDDVETDLFRPYSIVSDINGILTIRARHVSYDLSKVIVQVYEGEGGFSLTEVCEVLSGSSGQGTEDEGEGYLFGDHPFTVSYSFDNVPLDGVVEFDIPMTVRGVMLDGDKSMVGVFGGEWEFDNYNAIFHEKRGTNNGVEIRYAVNMSSFSSSLKSDHYVQRLYGFWQREDADGNSQLVRSWYNYPGSPGRAPVVGLVDLTAEFDEEPTEGEVANALAEYAEAHAAELNAPVLSLEVSAIDLTQTAEGSNLPIASIRLGDTVKVVHPLYEMSFTARCMKTVFNALTNKYEKISLNTTEKSIARTIALQQIKINKLTRG